MGTPTKLWSLSPAQERLREVASRVGGDNYAFVHYVDPEDFFPVFDEDGLTDDSWLAGDYGAPVTQEHIDRAKEYLAEPVPAVLSNLPMGGTVLTREMLKQTYDRMKVQTNDHTYWPNTDVVQYAHDLQALRNDRLLTDAQVRSLWMNAPPDPLRPDPSKYVYGQFAPPEPDPEPQSYEEYRRLTREQEARDRARFTGSDA